MTTAMDSEQAAVRSTGLEPESIAAYLAGAPPEMSQYAFFIGTWECELRVRAGSRARSGSAGEERRLRARWQAEWRHEGRILVDDLTVFAPNGHEILGWMNLRTFCAESGCWQISGHRALAASSGVVTRGHWRSGEMHLDFETDDAGQKVHNLVRFHEIRERSFEWVWEQRSEGASEWTRFAALSAQRS